MTNRFDHSDRCLFVDESIAAFLQSFGVFRFRRRGTKRSVFLRRRWRDKDSYSSSCIFLLGFLARRAFLARLRALPYNTGVAVDLRTARALDIREMKSSLFVPEFVVLHLALARGRRGRRGRR